MKKAIILFLAVVVTALLFGYFYFNKNQDSGPKVLVISKTVGFRHTCIPNGIAAIQKIGLEKGFQVDTTSRGAVFTDENLKGYSSVIFLNTTMDILDRYQEIAFERYIQAGGGFVGVHAAADTEYGWAWYGDLVGAYFQSHPATQEAKFIIKDKSFSATSFFQDTVWTRVDELYNFYNMNPDVNVILTVDESSYEGGENGEYHPMAWYHEYDGGRAFYTALGHTQESYEDDLYLQHLSAGIDYAMGGHKKLNYSKATSQYPPDQRRFTRENLAIGDFYEPTEMTILPNKDVLIAERRGGLKWYNNENGELSDIAKLDVYCVSGVPGVNAEEGFMGLQKDPNYAENHWIYTFYSPTGDEWVNRLSRFQFKDGVFDMDSEQVILDVASQRKICCHTGGSIAFGSDGLLYLSTGDNSTPFDEPDVQFVNNGYAPLNDLPGKEQYDARRSSGNTNDLRGKIIRIKVNEDGSYDIPEGNLFPEGTANTRPEIYTMGHRNPYRISVDPKKHWVFWGDVGPDAGEDAFETRGSRGYDEMNVATAAGNFGWPLFIADNKPYHSYDYSNGQSGEVFDPMKPINNSRNNTGLQELPPAQPAYMFYDYGSSMIHQSVESGGRNAMAGPTIYSDLYKGKNAPPAFYDGKTIIYDWMRGWMMAASFDEQGRLLNVDPFATDIELNSLIDMEIADDGTIYLLEYGKGWFAHNKDSGLSFIKYNGENLPPTIDHVQVDRVSGSSPLVVNVEVTATDLEDDPILYRYDMGNGDIVETSDAKISYTYEETGQYSINVEAIDDKEMKGAGTPVSVVSGNTAPDVEISLNGGNSSFYLPGVPVEYDISVSDAEDGTTLDPSKLFVSVDYIVGYDEAALNTGHQVISDAAMGESLIKGLDCLACHKSVGKSIGPSYTDIALRYQDKPNNTGYLAKTILLGSTGVWGETNMPAHPDLSEADAQLIAKYIESLAGQQNSSLPPSGTITPPAGTDGKTMVISATYTDNGHKGVLALTGAQKLALKNSTFDMADVVDIESFKPMEFGGMNLMLLPRNGGSFAYENMNLAGVKSVNVIAGWQSAPEKGFELEIRAGSPDGELLGSGKLSTPAEKSDNGMIHIPLTKVPDGVVDKLYIVYNPTDDDKYGLLTLIALVNVSFSSETGPPSGGGSSLL
jgi:glucose/arabinose dehydrogenase/cytochrome c551/c552